MVREKFGKEIPQSPNDTAFMEAFRWCTVLRQDIVLIYVIEAEACC